MWNNRISLCSNIEIAELLHCPNIFFPNVYRKNLHRAGYHPRIPFHLGLPICVLNRIFYASHATFLSVGTLTDFKDSVWLLCQLLLRITKSFDYFTLEVNSHSANHKNVISHLFSAYPLFSMLYRECLYYPSRCQSMTWRYTISLYPMM